MTRRTQGEGSVYMRKDGRAAASAMYEGKRITKYGKTKKEAWENLQAVLDDLKQGKAVIGPKQTVAQYLTRWLEDSQRLQLRQRSYGRYAYAVNKQIIPTLGHIQLDKLTHEDVQKLCTNLMDQGYAPRTVGKAHVVLRKALKDAVLQKMLSQNVTDHIALPRVSDYEARVLTWAECERLIEASQGYRIWFFLVLALVTGARRGELLALRWSDVDVETGLVFIHRSVGHASYASGYVENEVKTRAGRRKVRLPQFVLDLIGKQKEYLEYLRVKAGTKWQEHDLVFTNLTGGYMDEASIRKPFKRLLKKLGLPDMRIHDLRHSAATLLLASGVSPKVVQELLGHSDIKVTLGIYGHVIPGMQEKVIEVMDKHLGKHSE
ncbi:MAG: tyrosine-type recombinase/integrase [Ktedonobacteraceae bacterium]